MAGPGFESTGFTSTGYVTAVESVIVITKPITDSLIFPRGSDSLILKRGCDSIVLQ